MEKLKKETIQVNSMAIKKVTYNYSNNRLRLTFTNGKKYNYFNVPLDRFLSMKYSESIGKFINKHIIRSHKYSYVK
jgi:hypothetical protein